MSDKPDSSLASLGFARNRPQDSRAHARSHSNGPRRRGLPHRHANGFARGPRRRARRRPRGARSASGIRRGFHAAMEFFETRTQAIAKKNICCARTSAAILIAHREDEIRKRCSPESDLQIAIGDGLSVPAVAAQVPPLLPLLHEGARRAAGQSAAHS